LLEGDTKQAVEAYEIAHPRLFLAEPKIDRGNFQAAVDLAYVYRLIGDAARAQQLLDASRPIAEAFPRSGLPNVLSDVKIMAIEGDADGALARLERAVVAEYWRAYWWLFLTQDPALEGLRERDEFQRILAHLPARIDLSSG